MAKNISYEIDFDTPAFQELFARGFPQTFEAGRIINLQGEKPANLLYIRRGIVKHTSILPNGSEKTLAYETSPILFGTPSIYLEDGAPITTIAITALDTIAIPRPVAKQMIDNSLELSSAVIHAQCSKLHSLSVQSSGYYMPVPKRLAKFILNTAKYGIFVNNESGETPTLTHEDIASIIGSTRPRVSRFLNEFKKRGLIDITGGNVIIKNPDLLQKYIDE